MSCAIFMQILVCAHVVSLRASSCALTVRARATWSLTAIACRRVRGHTQQLHSAQRTHTHAHTQSRMCTLLPAMQFATLYSVQPDGKRVFLTSNGNLVCPHGECSSSINYWLRAERKARDAGLPIPPRGGSRGLSVCDCQNTDGMNGKIGEDCQLVTPPSSLFEFLEAQGTELIKVKGRDARRIPSLPGPTFVTSTGKICCRHGASRQSLINKQKAGDRPSHRLPACGCNLKPIPVRKYGAACVSMGKYNGEKPTLVKAAYTKCDSGQHTHAPRETHTEVSPPIETLVL